MMVTLPLHIKIQGLNERNCIFCKTLVWTLTLNDCWKWMKTLFLTDLLTNRTEAKISKTVPLDTNLKNTLAKC